ncbi:MAG: molybdopterin converting factor subunit 1 [Anaerolineaceae bacterium]|nr:molybdopterin converting factor subunit 1 [Anaerolineaceae bacterium]
MNPIQVLFFASLREQAGTHRAQIEIPDGARVSDLKSCLIERFPQLEKGLHSMLVAVNQEFAFDEDVVPGGAEVALFPPVSGGTTFSTIVQVSENTIDLNGLVNQITLKTTGAVCMFTGIVRGETHRGNPHETERLEYQAYVPMAEAKMHQVAEEIRRRWPEVEGIAIVQRIGILDPKTPTVIIACSAAHRDTGVFEAARFGIDRLKEIVPIWKKEIGTMGQVWVEGEYTPSHSDKG